MEIDCPTCSTLSPPIRFSAYPMKIHYFDSRTYVMCDECGLKITTDKYREWLATRKEEE